MDVNDFEGLTFRLARGNYDARVRVSSVVGLEFSQQGDPRMKVDATLLSGSTIAGKYGAKKMSSNVKSLRNTILEGEDEYSDYPASEPPCPVNEDLFLGNNVSPSHIGGVITGTSSNGNIILKCEDEPYIGQNIGEVFSCKALSRELGIDVHPEQLREWRTSYRAAFESGEFGFGLVEWVRNTLGSGNALTDSMVIQEVTIEELHTNAQTAGLGNQPRPSWKWSDIVRPLEENVVGLSRVLLEFHCREVPEEVVREAVRIWYNEAKDDGEHPTAEKQFAKSHWHDFRTWGLFHYDNDLGVFRMTPLGAGVAKGHVSYQKYASCICKRWQYPQKHLGGFGKPVEGVRLRPMEEIRRILKKLNMSVGQGYLSKEEQYGVIYDVSTRADVDGFVKDVIDSRNSGNIPDHWENAEKPARKAMDMVCFYMIAAGIVKREKSGSSKGRLVLL